MLAGHLQEKGGKYYAVLNCKHRNGKRFPKWVPTELTVKKGNKRAAEKMLEDFRTTYNVFGELPGEEAEVFEANQPSMQLGSVTTNASKASDDMLFADYMLYWLSYKELEVDPTTFAGYCSSVEDCIYPYFKQLGVKLSELQPLHLKEFYMSERKGDSEAGKKSKKGTTVVRYHANIHAALEAAMADGLIGKNAAHKQRPATEKFIGQFYLPEEALECIKHAEGTPLELAVMFGLFYGLRRSEILGLKWQNFDLVRNTFTISHTVTSVKRKGQKATIYAKDKTKNKSSMRTLPLVPMFQAKLKELWEQQQENRRLFGNSYNSDYIGYVCVNEIGEIVKPGYITNQFPIFLKKHNMRRIRFHDTRHSAATNMHQLTGDFYTVGMILGHSLKGIGIQLGISTNLEAVTAQYIDVRLDRKQTVLDAYHNALYPNRAKKKPAQPEKTQKKKGRDMER